MNNFHAKQLEEFSIQQKKLSEQEKLLNEKSTAVQAQLNEVTALKKGLDEQAASIKQKTAEYEKMSQTRDTEFKEQSEKKTKELARKTRELEDRIQAENEALAEKEKAQREAEEAYKKIQNDIEEQRLKLEKREKTLAEAKTAMKHQLDELNDLFERKERLDDDTLEAMNDLQTIKGKIKEKKQAYESMIFDEKELSQRMHAMEQKEAAYQKEKSEFDEQKNQFLLDSKKLAMEKTSYEMFKKQEAILVKQKQDEMQRIDHVCATRLKEVADREEAVKRQEETVTETIVYHIQLEESLATREKEFLAEKTEILKRATTLTEEKEALTANQETFRAEKVEFAKKQAELDNLEKSIKERVIQITQQERELVEEKRNFATTSQEILTKNQTVHEAAMKDVRKRKAALKSAEDEFKKKRSRIEEENNKIQEEQKINASKQLRVAMELEEEKSKIHVSRAELDDLKLKFESEIEKSNSILQGKQRILQEQKEIFYSEKDRFESKQQEILAELADKQAAMVQLEQESQQKEKSSLARRQETEKQIKELEATSKKKSNELKQLASKLDSLESQLAEKQKDIDQQVENFEKEKKSFNAKKRAAEEDLKNKLDDINSISALIQQKEGAAEQKDATLQQRELAVSKLQTLQESLIEKEKILHEKKEKLKQRSNAQKYQARTQNMELKFRLEAADAKNNELAELESKMQEAQATALANMKLQEILLKEASAAVNDEKDKLKRKERDVRKQEKTVLQQAADISTQQAKIKDELARLAKEEEQIKKKQDRVIEDERNRMKLFENYQNSLKKIGEKNEQERKDLQAEKAEFQKKKTHDEEEHGEAVRVIQAMKAKLKEGEANFKTKDDQLNERIAEFDKKKEEWDRHFVKTSDEQETRGEALQKKERDLKAMMQGISGAMENVNKGKQELAVKNAEYQADSQRLADEETKFHAKVENDTKNFKQREQTYQNKMQTLTEKIEENNKREKTLDQQLKEINSKLSKNEELMSDIELKTKRFEADRDAFEIHAARKKAQDEVDLEAVKAWVAERNDSIQEREHDLKEKLEDLENREKSLNKAITTQKQETLRIKKNTSSAITSSGKLAEPAQLLKAIQASKIARAYLSRSRTNIINQQAFDKIKTAKETKALRHRVSVLQEILSTERSYNHGIYTAVVQFITPAKNTPGLLDHAGAEIEILFSDLEVIVDVNKIFLSWLEERFAQWPANCNLGDVFTTACPLFKLYYRYIRNFSKARPKIETLTKSPSFKSFVEARREQKDSSKLNLESLLIMPVQRLPRYEMLMKTLLDVTGQSHVDYANLNQSLVALKGLNMWINDKQKMDDEKESIAAKYAMQTKKVKGSKAMRSAVGFLTVHVSEAQGLVGFHSKLPNAFAVLHFGDLEFCTIVKKGTATPKWDKEFIVQIHEDLLPEFTFRLVVFDSDKIRAREEIAFTTMHFNIDKDPQKSESGWHTLEWSERLKKKRSLETISIPQSQLKFTVKFIPTNN